MIAFVALVVVALFIYFLNMFIMASSDGDGYAFMGSDTFTVIFWFFLAIVLSVIVGCIGSLAS